MGSGPTAETEPGLKMPAPLQLRWVSVPVETGQDGGKLPVDERGTARGVMAVDQNRDG